MYRPIGRAIAMAMTRAAAEMPMCSARRVGMPPEPLQLAGSWNHATVSVTMSMAASGVPGAGRERRVTRVHGVSRRCTPTRTASATRASAMESTAPARISVAKARE